MSENTVKPEPCAYCCAPCGVVRYYRTDLVLGSLKLRSYCSQRCLNLDPDPNYDTRGTPVPREIGLGPFDGGSGW